MKKFIKITNRCYVTTSRGKIRGPVFTPFKEDVSIIYIMIVRDGAEVYEVCPNGRTVKLTTENFDKDNSGTKTVTKKKIAVESSNNISAAARSVAVQTQKPIETTPVETEQSVVVEDITTSETESDTEPTVANQTNSNKKNKRK